MRNFKTALDVGVQGCPNSLPYAHAQKCEFTLNIGLFFDGTDNNRNVEGDGDSRNTNVARLAAAYRHTPDMGSFRYYISGVGTPFTEIGESAAPSMGAPFGAGGEARIVYALLQVVNSVHRLVNGNSSSGAGTLFSLRQLAALCSETIVPEDSLDFGRVQTLTPQQQTLKDLGLSRGLVDAGDRRFAGHPIEGERRRFFMRIGSELACKVQAPATLPKVTAIYVDVIGFSRGAAQARVFVSWLHDLLLSNGKMFGAPSYVRLLGLFDTVSSVGLTDAAGGHGHNAWGAARDLRIHPDVKCCVHFLALHELRTNFPSDSVGGEEGVLPPNCSEHFYPGVHSDVGGGYAAGEQGKGGREVPIDPQRSQGGRRFEIDEGLKLSQFALNQMYDAALASTRLHECEPWIEIDSKAGDTNRLRERFAMTCDPQGVPRAKKAVARYFNEISGVEPGLNAREALRAHGLRYLAWRWRVTRDGRFEALASVRYAAGSGDAETLAYYRLGQRILEEQLRLLENPAPILDLNLTGNKEVRRGFHSKAPEIYAAMRTLKLHPDLEDFFDSWTHDSYAGFIGNFKKAAVGNSTLRDLLHIAAESQRYVRWRGLYCGSDTQLNVRMKTPARSHEA